MNNLLLKLGLLLFALTLIVSNHIEKNTFYFVKPLKIENGLSLEELRIYPLQINKFLTKENYYNILDTKNSYVRGLIVGSTVIEVKPFELSNSLFISIFLCIAVILIIAATDFKNINGKLLILSVPIIVAFVIINHQKPISQSKENLIDLKEKSSNMDFRLDRLRNDVDDLDSRLSDIENK